MLFCFVIWTTAKTKKKRPVQRFASSLWINVLTDIWKLIQGKHKAAVGKRQRAEEYSGYSLAAAGVFAHGKLVICLKLNLNINSGTRYLHFIHTADAQRNSALGNILFRLWLCPTPQATISIRNLHISLCMEKLKIIKKCFIHPDPVDWNRDFNTIFFFIHSAQTQMI